MKKKLRFLILFTTLIVTTQITIAEELAEKDIISSLIHELLQDHEDGNYEAWIKKWTDSNDITIYQTDHSGLHILQGLTLKNVMQNHFEARRNEIKNLGSKMEVRTSDMFIKVYQESAWAKFKIKWILTTNDNEPHTWETFENYFFEKVGDEWKITTITANNLD